MRKLESRWERRRELEEAHEARLKGPEWTLVEGSIDIAAPCEKVWEFLVTPESLLLLNESIVKVFRVPDTPVAKPGEQLCCVINEGELTAGIIETVALERPSLVATQLITGPAKVVERVSLSDLGDGGTRMTAQQGLARPSTRKTRSALQGHLDQSLRRTRAALESGAQFTRDT